MLIGIIYFIVIIMANTMGAISGMGGGVIIRPILDAIGYHDVASISFYSSIAVLTMAFFSTLKKIKDGVEIKPKIAISISMGSVTGGVIGYLVFQRLLRFFPNESGVQLIQISIIIMTLLFALLYTKFKLKTFNFTSMYAYFLVGGVLGFLGSLLGIGGGPINVAGLMLFFGMSIKNATMYSIIIILFSQFSRLITLATTTGFQDFDLNILFFIIPAAILGGILGSKKSTLLSEKAVTTVFQLVVILVIILNIINIVQII